MDFRETVTTFKVFKRSVDSDEETVSYQEGIAALEMWTSLNRVLEIGDTSVTGVTESQSWTSVDTG